MHFSSHLTLTQTRLLIHFSSKVCIYHHPLPLSKNIVQRRNIAEGDNSSQPKAKEKEKKKKKRASEMVSAAIARNVVGIIGNVISFGLFFSPAPTFYGIVKKKTVEEFKPDPYIATVLNCAFWVFYGMPFVHPHSILVLTINSVGLAFEFVYLTIYYIYATNKGRKKVLIFLLIEAIFFAAVVLITTLALHGTRRRSLVVGVLCDVFNVMMYVSPLTIMAKVVRTKSVKYMPFWLSLTNFLNGVSWTTYALIHPFDIYVLVISNFTFHLLVLSVVSISRQSLLFFLCLCVLISLRFFCAGNVISFGLFFSPAPTFYKIIKKKAVEEFKPDPYIATVLNCAFWVFYGMPFVHPHSILVVTINGIGLVFEFVYLAIFFTYATSKGRKKLLLYLLVEAIFFAVIALVTMLVLHATQRRSLVVGVICDVFNVMMYVSPLTIMAKVIKTKSVKYMPFWLSLTNFLNGVCWTTFALIHPFDLFLLISNSIGAISGFVQLILYTCYCCREENNNDGDNDQKPTGLPVSECPPDVEA
ncbi:Bidirectional sugar transporter SWEET7b [Spatholobus suberectus]|nr:Bidirectional sugar transporter SWEET7b [Spatholobus suberectus]